MFQSLKEKLAQFSVKTMLRKAVITAAQAGAAYAVAHTPELQAYAGKVGVSVSVDPAQVEAALVLVIGGALESGRNLAKRIGPAWLTGWL